MTFREVMQKLGIWTSVQRKTYKTLSLLTDRELKDVGLCRGEINSLIEEMGEMKDTEGKDT